MKFIVIVLLIAQSGCISSQIQSVSTFNGEKIVVMKYLNQGADFVIKQRREDAIKKAKDLCGGGMVSLLNESNNERTSGAYIQSVNNYTFLNETTTNYSYLTFKCLENNGQEIY